MKLADLFIKLGLRKEGFDKGLNDAKNKTNAFGGAMKKIGGVIAGAFAVGSIIAFTRKLFNTIKDFEQANATLAATLSKSTSDIQKLTRQALDLGKSTEFTAKQVSYLQNELAKLGFSEIEIQKSARGILDLSSATGYDLAAAAKVAGSALRAFNLDASEMDRVTSVLAVATTKSALSMADYEASLSTVAPVARAFGFTIEDTVALFGKLKDAGFDASSSATATRNILLNLADANGKLTKAIGGPVKSFDDLIPALVKLRDSGVDLNTTLQLTDKRSVAAFNQFLQGAEKAQVLRDSLIDVNDELDQMVKTKTDTLVGAINRLTSAWEGFVLSGSGAAGTMKSIIDGMAKAVGSLGSDIGKTGTGPGFGLGFSILRMFGFGDKELDQAQKEVKERLANFNKLTVAELEKSRANIETQLNRATEQGDTFGIAKLSIELEAVTNRIDELNKKPIVPPSGEKEITTLETSIKNLKTEIADLQGQLERGEIIDTEDLKTKTKDIDELKNSLKKLLELQSYLGADQTISKLKQEISDLQDQLSFTPTSNEQQIASIKNEIRLRENLISVMDNQLKKLKPLFDKSAIIETINIHLPKVDLKEDELSGMFGLNGLWQRVFASEKAAEEQEKIRQSTEDFISDINSILEGGIEDGLVTLGEQLGQAFTTGDWSNFGNAILGVVGQFLVQMGTALIAYGVAMKAFKDAFSNPFVAIAAGVALVAIGSAISSMASAGPGSSSSASAYSGASGYSAGSSTATTALAGDVRFVLEGDKLVGAIGASNRRRAITG